MAVDVICSTYNAAPLLPEFLESLKSQSYTDWRLWVRDDGSDDASVRVLRDALAGDPRLRHVEAGGPRLGPSLSFGWLLDQLPANAEHIMWADQDDVWLPGKIE